MGEPERYWFNRQGEPIADPYEILGVAPNASSAELEKAYRDLIRRHPPERDPAGFQKISAAFRLLTEPEQILFRRYGFLERIDPGAFGLETESAAPKEPSSKRYDLAEELFMYALVHSLPFDSKKGSTPEDESA